MLNIKIKKLAEDNNHFCLMFSRSANVFICSENLSSAVKDLDQS